LPPRCERALAERKRAVDEDREEPDHESRAREPELLGDDGEDEIRVCLGEVEELLDARAQADAEPVAATNCDERVRELESARERVTPRIEKRRKAFDPIRRGKRQRAEHAARNGCRKREIAQPRAGDEKHAEARCDDYDRRPEIRLREQQETDGRDDEQGPQEAFRARREILLTSDRIACEVDEHA
jgi:hypothetical protein